MREDVRYVSSERERDETTANSKCRVNGKIRVGKRRVDAF